MSRPVYTTLLGDAKGSGVFVIGGPWPGFRVVVTDISIGDTAEDSTYAVVNGTLDQSAITGWFVGGAPASGVVPWHGTQVLQDGDTLQVETDGSAVAVRASGWLLTLP